MAIEYFPLFDTSYSPARPVFTLAGAPVFARIREGSLYMPLSVQGVAQSVSGAKVPGGSITWNTGFLIARTSFGSFYAPYERIDQGWQYIGTEASVEWYMRCTAYYPSANLNQTNKKFEGAWEIGVQRGYKNSSGNIVVWDGAYTIFHHYGAVEYTPDCEYAFSSSAYASGYCSVFLGNPFVALFVES